MIDTGNTLISVLPEYKGFYVDMPYDMYENCIISEIFKFPKGQKIM